MSEPDYRTLAEQWQASGALHPWTCNGGNPDFATHHTHEVVLVPGDTGFVCPECGREQPYGEWEKEILRRMADQDDMTMDEWSEAINLGIIDLMEEPPLGYNERAES